MSLTRSSAQKLLGRSCLYSLVWGSVLVLSWFTARRGQELGGTAAWAGLLHPVVFGLTAWPVIRRFVRGDRWFTIPSAVLGLSYLTIGLGAVYFVFHSSELGYPPLQTYTDVRAALLVAVAGILAYRLAAEVPWYRGLVRRLPGLPSAPQWPGGVRIGAFAAIGFSAAVLLYLAATGSLGFVTASGESAGQGLVSLLVFLSKGGLLALAGAYYYWLVQGELTTGDKVVVVSATILLAGIGLLSGMKEEFLFVFLGLAVPFSWGRFEQAGRRHPWKGVLLSLCLVVLLVALFALNPLYRASLRQVSDTQSRIQQGPAAAADVIQHVAARTDPVPLLLSGVENAWSRLSLFPYHLAVVDQVPEQRSFRKFQRYESLAAAAVVPRVVWPRKPVNTSGADFQRSFISGETIFSTTPTVYGWGYWELGIVGVIFIMLVLGGVTGVVESYLAQRERGTLFAVIAYTALFVGLAEVEADPYWLLGGLPKLLAVAVFVYLLFLTPTYLRRVDGTAGDRSAGEDR